MHVLCASHLFGALFFSVFEEEMRHRRVLTFSVSPLLILCLDSILILRT